MYCYVIIINACLNLCVNTINHKEFEAQLVTRFIKCHLCSNLPSHDLKPIPASLIIHCTRKECVCVYVCLCCVDDIRSGIEK